MNRQLYAVAIAVSIGTLTGCTSFNVVSPPDMTTVRTGSTIPVDVTANPRFNSFGIAVDAHPTAPVPCPSATECTGPLNVPAGRHAVTINANVPCTYCSTQQYSYSVTRSVCVGNNPAIFATMAVVASASSNGQVWSNDSDSVGSTIAPPANASLNVQWRTFRLGGVGSKGVIQSVANDCLCMQSRNDASNPGIILAFCDLSGNTTAQLWESFPSGNGNLSASRFLNSADQTCITAGASGSLQNQSCDLSAGATPKLAQIWTLKDLSGNVASPF